MSTSRERREFLRKYLRTWQHLLTPSPNVSYHCPYCSESDYPTRFQVLAHQADHHWKEVFEFRVQRFSIGSSKLQVRDLNLIEGYYVYQRYKELEEDLICKVCRKFMGRDDGSDLVGHYLSHHFIIIQTQCLNYFK